MNLNNLPTIPCTIRENMVFEARARKSMIEGLVLNSPHFQTLEEHHAVVRAITAAIRKDYPITESTIESYDMITFRKIEIRAQKILDDYGMHVVGSMVARAAQ